MRLVGNFYIPRSVRPVGNGRWLGEEWNGSRGRLAFTANSGDRLEYAFNYVTTDGGDYTDYAWARLLKSDPSEAALLFTARTTPGGNTVPGFGLPLPDPGVTLAPASTSIISGDPAWSPWAAPPAPTGAPAAATPAGSR